MIVLEKDGNKTAPLALEEAQKLVNKGWNVFINKSGVKLNKQKAKAKKAKKEDKE